HERRSTCNPIRDPRSLRSSKSVILSFEYKLLRRVIYMANAYKDLKDKLQKEFNEFPTFFAFNDVQFLEGLDKFGLGYDDLHEIASLGGGGYYRKSDTAA